MYFIYPKSSITNKMPLLGQMIYCSNSVLAWGDLTIPSLLNCVAEFDRLNTLENEGEISPAQKIQMQGNMHQGIPNALFFYTDNDLVLSTPTKEDIVSIIEDCRINVGILPGDTNLSLIQKLYNEGYVITSKIQL